MPIRKLLRRYLVPVIRESLEKYFTDAQTPHCTAQDFDNRKYDLYYHDVLTILDRTEKLFPEKTFSIQTEYPVATGSIDHRMPRGTKNDNTRHPRFVRACERHFPKVRLRHMDMGCAGGGLILDFLLRGHEAVGVEGSDFSKKALRATWRLLDERNLFTADITKPFQISYSGDEMSGKEWSANFITAWEVMEHIKEAELPRLFENVRRHLRSDGYFIGSIALFDDMDDGISYHPTIKPKCWWENKFSQFGLPFTEKHDFDHLDFCRGSGNGINDWDVSRQPELGFHFVAKKEGE
jgi:SAM-dependent methyltransferase